MDHMVASLTSIALAVIGVATLTVLVRQNSKTTDVVKATAQGFSAVLNTAMGGGSNSEYASMGLGL